MEFESRMLIDGELVDAEGRRTYDNVNPATEAVIGPVADATPADMERAIGAARRAFDETTWATDRAFRKSCLQQLKDSLEKHKEELRPQIVAEVGTPVGLTYAIQQDTCIEDMQWDIDLVDRFEWEYELGNHEFFGMNSNRLVIREAMGVVGAITPWNYPLHQIANKVAPALAAGCTVVVKPSEVAPINAFILAEIVDAARLPKGVFNLVTGVGPVVGEAIASHPLVDMVSFTGSTRAGKRVMELASQSVKRVSLELGGKSANIICDDADLEKAIPTGVFACYLNSGQTCSALTRMLVPRSKLAEVEKLAAATAETFTPGDPFAETTKLGPLVSEVQRDRVRGFIQKGVDEGAKLVTGGAEQPDGLEKGFYIRPTVFSNVTNDMTIAREEIFGPVLSIIPYDTEEEAIEVANDTPYGLAGGVWAGSQEHAIEIAQRLRTGQVDVNGGSFNPFAPFGGYKQSGVGRELGKYGFEEFLEVKSIQR